MKPFLKSFSIVTIFALLTRGVSFIFKIYLSRILGAEVLGLYQISLSIFMFFAAFTTSGIPLFVSKITAQHTFSKETFSTISSSLIVAITLSSIPCFLILTFPNLFLIFFQDERCLKILVILIPLFFTVSMYCIIRSFFWGNKDFFVFSLSEFLDEILKVFVSIVIFSIASYYSFKNIFLYAYAMIIGDFLLIIIIFVIYFSKKGKLTSPTKINEVVKGSAPISMQRILASLLSSFISIVLPYKLSHSCGLSVSQSTAEFGRASAMVMSLVMAPNAILGSLNVILLPDIAKLSKNKDNLTLSNKLNKSFLLSCVISSIFLTLFISLGKEIGSLLYNDPYVGDYLSIACFIVIPQSINWFFISILNTTKKELPTFYTYVISSLFLIAIIYLTPKYISIYSYFLALFVFHSISCLLNGMLLNKQFGISTKSLMRSILIVLYAIICGIIIRILSSKANMLSFVKISIFGLLCAISYLVPILIFTLNKKQPSSSPNLHKITYN